MSRQEDKQCTGKGVHSAVQSPLLLIPQASRSEQREAEHSPSLRASHPLAQSPNPVTGASLRESNGMGEDHQRKHMMSPERRPGEEEPKKAAPDEAETGEGAGMEASCDYCGGAAAAVYCRADAARLCLPCDRHVHGANGVLSRHARAPLCADCRATGSIFRRASTASAAAGLFLCSDCDFERHRDGGDPPLHDRCAVQAYTGCPPANELAALLGAPLFEKPPADGDGWWDIWEEPQVLSLEDLIVPTTPCHGFQPLLTPCSPKNRSISPDGKMNEEILRQLGELAESDGGMQRAAGHEEAEQAGDQFASWAPPQYVTGHGSFGTENSHEVATMPTPGYENSSWNNSDYHAQNDACKVEITYEQAPVSSAEACLSSFVPMSEICPSMSNGSSMDDNHQANPGIGMPTQAFPKKGGFDVVPCPDRDSVISRYKEKRKTRRFDKQVRYESRKVRADGRLRIKGRFAKANQT
ncbi:zinc finger protein CONSTANS-LIKE 13-like [Phragmites australis]|uniref:zinc finger protein CONSTANS-LIKE 13-like n=1 Tax=Phragmites australis TaxID=29695 RepID=UPI002D76E3B8|nr:zinc finger protein CONSTANS-LIKE 13-like [Phragmites australis]